MDARLGPRRASPNFSFVRAFALSFALAALLFPVGLATHEVMHLAVYSAMGVPAVVQATHWHFGLPFVSQLTIFGLHTAPSGSSGVPLNVLVANNGLGPLLAAVPLFVLWLAADRRSRLVRAALMANVLVLLFFSAIEVAYPLLEQVGGLDGDVLLLPAVNFGAVLLIIVLGPAIPAWRSSHPRLRVVGGMRGSSGSSSGRLPAP